MLDTDPCWPLALLDTWVLPEEATLSWEIVAPQKAQRGCPLLEVSGNHMADGSESPGWLVGTWVHRGLLPAHSPGCGKKASCWQHISGTVSASGVSDLVLGISKVWEDKQNCSGQGRETQRQQLLHPAGEYLGALLAHLSP